MESNKKRYVLGILVMTIIFACFSVFLIINLYDDSSSLFPKNEKKESYIVSLENELDIKLNASNNPYDVIAQVPFDTLIVPYKYEEYVKPCFDFVLSDEGIVIKNATAKDFYNYEHLKVGTVITKINDKLLSDLSYFEVLSLIYSNGYSVKTFTTKDNKEFEYSYTNYSKKLEFNEVDPTTLKIDLFNLDSLRRNTLYDLCLPYDNIIIDLSKTSVTTLDGLVEFLSLFSKNKTKLFAGLDIYGYDNLKILKNVEILVDDNQDLGINFMLNVLKKMNLINVDIPQIKYVSNFYSINTISDYYYMINIYSLELKLNENSGLGEF